MAYIGRSIPLFAFLTYVVTAAPSPRLADAVRCSNELDCAPDERCDEICSWSHPAGDFTGCAVVCVKRVALGIPAAFTATIIKPTKSDDDFEKDQVYSAKVVKPSPIKSEVKFFDKSAALPSELLDVNESLMPSSQPLPAEESNETLSTVAPKSDLVEIDEPSLAIEARAVVPRINGTESSEEVEETDTTETNLPKESSQNSIVEDLEKSLGETVGDLVQETNITSEDSGNETITTVVLLGVSPLENSTAVNLEGVTNATEASSEEIVYTPDSTEQTANITSERSLPELEKRGLDINNFTVLPENTTTVVDTNNITDVNSEELTNTTEAIGEEMITTPGSTEQTSNITSEQSSQEFNELELTASNFTVLSENMTDVIDTNNITDGAEATGSITTELEQLSLIGDMTANARTDTPAPLIEEPDFDKRDLLLTKADGKKVCPTPKACAPNCAIYVDEDGCQGCQCIWRSDDCDKDNPCRDPKKECEFGRCQCKSGYVQDMKHSGVCKADTETNVKGSGLDTNTITKKGDFSMSDVDESASRNIEEKEEHLRSIVSESTTPSIDALESMDQLNDTTVNQLGSSENTTDSESVDSTTKSEGLSEAVISFESSTYIEPPATSDSPESEPVMASEFSTSVQPSLSSDAAESGPVVDSGASTSIEPSASSDAPESEPMVSSEASTSAQPSGSSEAPESEAVVDSGPSTPIQPPTSSNAPESESVVSSETSTSIQTQSSSAAPESAENTILDDEALDSEELRIRRDVRTIDSKKPRESERLQWPGPCDEDGQCPPNLYCINGDCWNLPNKPIRSHVASLSNTLRPGRSPGSRSVISNRLAKYQRRDRGIVAPTNYSSDNTSMTVSPDFRLFRPSSYLDNDESGAHHSSALPPSLRPRQGDPDYEAEDISSSPENTESDSDTITSYPSSSTPVPYDGHTIPFREVSRPFTKAQQEQIPLLDDIKSYRYVQRPTTSATSAPTDATNDYERDVVRSAEDEVVTIAPSAHEHPVGVWVPMTDVRTDAPSGGMSSRSSNDNRIFAEYTMQRRLRRPVRVEMRHAKEVFRDECKSTDDCGEHFVCCRKEWCDLTDECAYGHFCLPSCELTKMTHLASNGGVGASLIDIIYD